MPALRTPSGSLGPNTSAHYAVTFDGVVYHSCALDQATSGLQRALVFERPRQATYRPQQPAGDRIGRQSTVGDGRRVYSVSDLATGTVFGTDTTLELFGAGAAFAIASRVPCGGVLACWRPPERPTDRARHATPEPRRSSGAILAQGDYAPFPPGITLNQNNWSTKWPVIDGYGALIISAWAGDDAVIVRRPMSGQSEIVYRQTAYHYSHAHQVFPAYPPDSTVIGNGCVSGFDQYTDIYGIAPLAPHGRRGENRRPSPARTSYTQASTSPARSSRKATTRPSRPGVTARSRQLDDENPRDRRVRRVLSVRLVRHRRRHRPPPDVRAERDRLSPELVSDDYTLAHQIHRCI